MQCLKSDIRKDILTEAEKLFLNKGFQGTSMREIAQKSNVGLSNIYNYFHSKDDIYQEILMPVIRDLYHLFYTHHSGEQVTMDVFTSVEYRKRDVEDYMKLVEQHRVGLKLLLFYSQGSSLDSFREQLTDKMTVIIDNYFRAMKYKYPHLNVDISPFFLHLQISWTFTMLGELVTHRIEKEDLKRFITEYVSFGTAGWKELMDA